MKILYHHRIASRDGQAVHVEEFIHALRSLGHEVMVLGPSGIESTQAAPPPTPADDTTGAGKMGDDLNWVHHLKKAMPKFLYELLELGYSALAYRRLLQAARSFQPDLIYERYNLYLLGGIYAARRLKIPLMLEINAPLVYEREHHSGGLALPALARWAEGKAWREATHCFAVTDVLADYLRRAGVPNERISITPNGINLDHFERCCTPEQAKERLGWSGKVVLGFTGFVRAWHGLDRIIRWIASSPIAHNVNFLIVGDGPARNELEALSRSLGVADQVRFTGVVDRHQVPDLVAAFDIALQPAVTDYASPLKLIEYLVMGKAIIAPNQRNLRELLEPKVNAILFEPDQSDQLFQALEDLVSHPEKRTQLGQAAHRTIAERQLTWTHNAEVMVQRYREHRC